MRVTLTPELVRKAKPGPQRVFLWDALVPGLGLVVHPSGRKGYVCQETRNGRRRRNLDAPSLTQARKAVLALSTGLVKPEAVTVVQLEPPPHPVAAPTMKSLLDGWLIALSERPSPPRSLPRIAAATYRESLSRRSNPDVVQDLDQLDHSGFREDPFHTLPAEPRIGRLI